MKKFNVLVVEDDLEIAPYIVMFLDRVIPNSNFFKARDKTEALKFITEKEFDLITLDGQLLNGDHGRDVLKGMSEDQILKTIVYSCDSDFLKECQAKGIKAVNKIHCMIDKLVAVEGESIVFKVV
jgi:response regulator of citrate/malate metabolism